MALKPILSDSRVGSDSLSVFPWLPGSVSLPHIMKTVTKDLWYFFVWQIKHYPSSGNPPSHATVVYGEVPHSTFYILLLTFCFLPTQKNIASAKEGPSWALICIIQLLMGVWDLNEVYCLKTGLAAWPSCLSKTSLRNSQLWNCHDNSQSTVAQVFEPEVLSKIGWPLQWGSLHWYA